MHNVLKINQLCGHWDYFGQDEESINYLEQTSFHWETYYLAL